MLLVTMTTVSFYFITAYTPTFGRTVLRLSDADSLLVTLCIGISNLFWLPVAGAVSDRIGRRPLLYACTALALLTAYPALWWLVQAPSFGRMLAVELWLSFLYGCYNGAMVVYLTEIMPVRGPHGRVLAGLQPGDRDFRRQHPGDRPGAVPRNRQPGDGRAVAELRRRLRAAGDLPRRAARRHRDPGGCGGFIGNKVALYCSGDTHEFV